MFLQSDPSAAGGLHRLESYIDEKLAGFRNQLGDEKFDRVIATSATAAAIVSAVNRIQRSRRSDADRMRASTAQVRELYAQLACTNVAGRRKMTGIGPKRAEIIVAGAGVFLRALQLFGQRSMYYSAAGVRDGIIADLAARGVGRELSHLSREQRLLVEGMAKRYGVPVKHARQVACLAHRLFEILQPVHRLPPPAGKLLVAAAYLHDIGHFVSDTAHHKHSAYLVANSDMPGFTAKERTALAALCRFHRKSMPQPRHTHFQALDAEAKKTVASLAPLLRIADALDRSHEQRVRNITRAVLDGSISLSVEADTDTDLELWAANEAAKAFLQVYSRPLSLQKSKPSRRA